MITEGKWQVGYNDGSGPEYITNGDKPILAFEWGCSCCKREVETFSDLTGEQRANAQAISAVPDMIEALQDLIKQWEEFDYDQSDLVLDKARAALEKAGINGEHMKGRGND